MNNEKTLDECVEELYEDIIKIYFRDKREKYLRFFQFLLFKGYRTTLTNNLTNKSIKAIHHIDFYAPQTKGKEIWFISDRIKSDETLTELAVQLLI